MQCRHFTCLLTTVFVLAAATAANAQTPAFTTVRMADLLSGPILVTYAPGDASRAFVIEQQGRIRILKNGVLLATPFLDVDAISSSGGERGLLGLAFDPNYQTNGYFYINYTDNSGNTVVARYQVSANPEVANPGSALRILGVVQPFANHNGGWMGFGPDGFLYIALGDGGDANDPGNRAQNINELLGKMLRVDITHDDFPADATRFYAIPPTNPFAGVAGADEIWAVGLRNPWRNSFDRQTGDLWIADVGQAAWEEIDFQAAGAVGGRNYGWRCMEGFACTGLTGCTCNSPGLTLPIYAYGHTGGRCSVTGGYVYRGSAIPDLKGLYMFADYCTAQVYTLRYDGATVSELTERTATLAPGFGRVINDITSFGEDAAGELYITDPNGGEVYKIIANRAANAKLQPDNHPYALRGIIVTAAFPGYFYVQDDLRPAGIRVEAAGHTLALGMRADVLGVLKTNAAGERYVQASSASQNGTGTLAPLGVNGRALGGGDHAYDPTTGAGQRGVLNGSGPNSIGLLVRIWGRVVQRDPAPTPMWFVLEDGSTVSPPPGLTPQVVSRKVIVPAGVTAPAVGQFVSASGVVSTEPVTGGIDPVVLVRTQADIRTY